VGVLALVRLKAFDELTLPCSMDQDRAFVV
jgi:hypothetical protein